MSKQYSEKYNVPMKFSHVFSMAILPIIFGLFMVFGVEGAQPISTIFVMASLLLFLLVIIYSSYAKVKNVLYTKQIEDWFYIISFSLTIAFFNVATLYLLLQHLFWFIVVLMIWLVSITSIIVIYLRFNNQLKEDLYKKIKKLYFKFYLWFGVMSCIVFLLATLGYNRFVAQNENVVPPSIFFFGKDIGHIIIMMSFSICMTLIYNFGIFAAFERSMKRRSQAE